MIHPQLRVMTLNPPICQHLNSRHLLLTVLEEENSKINVLADLVLGESLVLHLCGCLLFVHSHGLSLVCVGRERERDRERRREGEREREKGREQVHSALSPSYFKATNLIIRVLTS